MKLPEHQTLLVTAMLIASILTTVQAKASLRQTVKERFPQYNINELPLRDVSCSLSSSGNNVNYGNMTRSQFSPLPAYPNMLTPGTRSLILTVTCSESRVLLLTLTGEPSPYASGLLRYGAMGVINLNMTDASVDGKSVLLRLITRDGTAAKGASKSVPLMPGSRVAPVLNGRPVRGRTLTARLEITPALNNDSLLVTAPNSQSAHFSLHLLK